MASATGTAFGSPLLESRRSSGKYGYRHRMGLVACAEFDVFHDDFHSFIVSTAITNGPVANTPLNGWQGAIIDSGSTVAVNTTAAIGANGVLTFADATASEGAAIYTNKSFQLTAGKSFFVEIRVRTDDVSDNTIQFGLSDQTAVSNPEDLYTTTAANVLAFGLLDTNGAYPVLLSDKSNGGTSVQTHTNKVMVVDTWHTLAIGYDGAQVRGYIDGDAVVTYTTAATIPTGVAMGLFIAHRNGDGAGGALCAVDYIRAVGER